MLLLLRFDLVRVFPCFSWGIAVLLGVLVSGGVSGGHVNPAVTVSVATLGKFPWWKVRQ